MKIRKTGQSAGLIATVIDKLTSSSKTDALSANQGKILDEKINNINKNNMVDKIVFSSTAHYQIDETYNSKIVKNGWCTIRLYLSVINPTTSQIALASVPMPLTTKGMPHWQFHIWEKPSNGTPLIVVVTEDGQFNLRQGVAGEKYFVNIAYPIVE